MSKIKLPKNWLMWVIGILFVMSIMPGEGTKASDQQAIVESDYLCTTVEDCPVCVGSGIYEYNYTTTNEQGFLEELSYATCNVNGRCELSDACLIWGCPTGSMKLNESGVAVPCESIKQTILDNTIQRFNENPVLLFIIIGAILAYIFLK